jgi:hypothetical protein
MYMRSLVLFAAALGTAGAQPKIAITPMDTSMAAVLAIAGPSDPAVQASLENSFPARALPFFQPILPYSIVIRSNAPMSIVAVAVYVDTLDRQGRTRSELQGWGDIPPVDKNDFLLAPGQELLATPDGRYSADAKHFRLLKRESLKPNDVARLQQLARRPIDSCTSASNITFAIDSVLLADGKFLGPDKANAFTGWTGRIANEAALARAVLAFQGHSEDELQRYLTSVAAMPRQPRLNGDISPAQLAASYRSLLKKKGTQGLFDIAETDLQRATAFTIHR